MGSAPEGIDARTKPYHALCGAWLEVTLACELGSLSGGVEGLKDILALPGAHL